MKNQRNTHPQSADAYNKLKTLRKHAAYIEERAFNEEIPFQKRLPAMKDYEALVWAIRILDHMRSEKTLRAADEASSESAGVIPYWKR